MRVGPAVNVARVSVDETITALWTFANALGLLTDDINERTAAAGVTIDGLLVRDSGIPQAAVTAHEAALAILESQIVDDGILARLQVNEAITGLWSFANALGFNTDIIGERTAAAGVTIDGALIRDISFAALALAAGPDLVFRTNVIGDTFDRFVMQADGRLRWGPGSGGGDTVLYRAAINLLATDDDLRVAGVLGVLTDVISERTAVAGVTIDGLLLQDGAVDARGRGSSVLDVIISNVIGDSNTRFNLLAGGQMLWGPGDAALDTLLEREAANELGTPDDFNVGGALDLGGDLELSEATTVVVATPINDFATGTQTVQRVSTTVILTITGFAGGRQGRLMLFSKFAPVADISFTHEDTNSAAANRIRTPGGGTFILASNNALWFWYDNTLARWILVAPST